MLIRKYSAADKAEVISLLRLNTPTYFAPEEEEDLACYLENHADNYYVVELDGQIRGCGGFNLSEDVETAKISWDIIHPERHGKGLGSALTKYRIDLIRQIPGVHTLSVRTSQLVYPFYEKFSLELKEVVKDFWAEGFDLYRMECRLK